MKTRVGCEEAAGERGGRAGLQLGCRVRARYISGLSGQRPGWKGLWTLGQGAGALFPRPGE